MVNITIEKTRLEGVLLIKPEAFEDHRGWFLETYNEKIYREHGIDVKFVQDDISISSKGVLRGIHGDNETFKLVSCIFGKVYLVVVNCDKDSGNFGEWQSFLLSDYSWQQVLIPPKFGNGHLILSERAIFQYKQSTYYNPVGQFSYKWNDAEFDIWWPIKNPVLSRRDESGRYID